MEETRLRFFPTDERSSLPVRSVGDDDDEEKFGNVDVSGLRRHSRAVLSRRIETNDLVQSYKTFLSVIYDFS
jgi:hypothetical protein